MRKNIIILFLLLTAINSSCQQQKDGKPENHSNKDLSKIKWIEGSWRGMYNGKPFYEIYKFENDSTIRITHYDWNGKDSSNTSYDFLYFKNGDY